jgi:hypothetical protein
MYNLNSESEDAQIGKVIIEQLDVLNNLADLKYRPGYIKAIIWSPDDQEYILVYANHHSALIGTFLWYLLTGQARYCFECRHVYPSEWRGDDWRYCALCAYDDRFICVNCYGPNVDEESERCTDCGYLAV